MEGFQAGLSWRTILAKRERFRAAFCGFDFNRVAEFTDEDVARLLGDAGIVRHRGKIEAAINNARRARELVASEGSLAQFVWSYEPKAADLAPPQTVSTSPASTALSKELKRRGWRFVGPTTVYAFMQAMGLVNDHADECVIRPRGQAPSRTVPAARRTAARVSSRPCLSRRGSQRAVAGSRTSTATIAPFWVSKR